MTPNAGRYYYRDAEGLMSELSQRGNERFYTKRLAAIEDPGVRLAMTISAGIPAGPDDTEWRVTWRAALAGNVTDNANGDNLNGNNVLNGNNIVLNDLFDSSSS